MNTGIRKLMLKLFILIIPFICLAIIVPVFMICDPMRFFDGEYAWYRQNSEYAAGHEGYCRVLIMGDSVAKAAWLPSELTNDTYNYSLGGASPIEEYYCLYDYLQNNDAPEYVIYSQMMDHFFAANCFWARGAYFHRLSAAQLLDVYITCKDIEDENGPFSAKSILDIPLYGSYSPVYYSTAAIKGMVMSRRQSNETAYQAVIEDRGHMYFGEGNSKKIGANQLVEERTFQCGKTIDYYFRKIIELCESYDIEFIYQSCPLTRITYENLKDTYVSDFNAYAEQLQQAYPDVVLNMELYCYDNSLFNDNEHLGVSGAMRFTRAMREKYGYVFVEEKA